MSALIPVLLAAVALATFVNVALKRFNIPTVIGYILTGAIIGPLFGIHAEGHEALAHLAEFGIVFLMFTIGLEFSLSHLLGMKREVFLFGALQVMVTGAMFCLIAVFLFDLHYKPAIIVSFGLALSSTAIVLKILNETGQIKLAYGRYSLGILLFQDLAVIPILLMITIFTSTDRSLVALLLENLIHAVIALSILLLVGKYALGHVFKAVSRAKSKEIYMGFVLLTVVSASVLAHVFGFSYSLGGFIAGMMIAETIYKYQVEADLVPFRDLLLGVFFFSVGLQIDLGVVGANLGIVVLLSIGIMLIKAFILFGLLALSAGQTVALRTAISLSQVGEFSLVLFSLLAANALVDSLTVQLLILAVVISIIITPLVINHAEQLVQWLFHHRGVAEPVMPSSLVGGHLILCGYGAFGRALSDRLDQAGIDHLIVTDNTDAYIKAKEAGKSAVYGDAGDRMLLEQLRIEQAMVTVIALDDMETTKRVSAAIRLIDPSLKVIAKVPTEEDLEQLRDFNHELVIDGNSNTAALLVDNIQRSRLLAAETSQLQFLGDYSPDDPATAIVKVEREQARLLDLMSASFEGLRQSADLLRIKAFSDSFRALSEIIGRAIERIMSLAKLSPRDYERLNILLHNQHLLIDLNQALEALARELKQLEQVTQTSSLSRKTVEGLDAVLLTVKDLAQQYDEADLQLLRRMTSDEHQGLARIRECYLREESGLDVDTKALLLSCTNHIDQLRRLFGAVGDNYRTLARLAEAGGVV